MGVCGPVSSSKKNISTDKLNTPQDINTLLLNNRKNLIMISVEYIDNYNDEQLTLFLDKTQKLSDLINEMKLDLQCDYDFYDSNNTLINDKLNLKLGNIFDLKNPINIKIKQYSLQLPRNNQEYFLNNNFLVGTLTFNNSLLLEIFIYNITSRQLLSFEYPVQDYSQVKFINHFTSFCNANNNLYISGGENEEDGVTDFIKINLEEIKQNELPYDKLSPLNIKRYWHSMIFIPEKYIFIIGGSGVKETEIYDIMTNEIKIDGKLNYERCEPSLILVNNKYLYCICGFELNNNFVNTIEKCNLFKKERIWEIVNYQIKSKEQNTTVRSLIVSFFGVSYINNDIILIGDKENNYTINPNYLLKPNENDIDIIEEFGFIETNNTRLFSEKFFIPINNIESISLPFKTGEPKIMILNNNNGNIKEIILKETYEDINSDSNSN